MMPDILSDEYKSLYTIPRRDHLMHLSCNKHTVILKSHIKLMLCKIYLQRLTINNLRAGNCIHMNYIFILFLLHRTSSNASNVLLSFYCTWDSFTSMFILLLKFLRVCVYLTIVCKLSKILH